MVKDVLLCIHFASIKSGPLSSIETPMIQISAGLKMKEQISQQRNLLAGGRGRGSLGY